MRSILCLTLVVSLAACETTTDPFTGIGGTGGISAAQAAGSWTFTVQRTSTLGCTTGSLNNGQTLTATLAVATDGTVSAATSSWQNPPNTTLRPLSGTVNLSTGFADLFMSAATGSPASMELRGTMSSAGSFSGNLTDPAPGSFQVFGACAYDVTGIKTA